jgi:uncharacterized protein YcnI
MKIPALGLLTLLVAVPSFAHVTVAPQQSAPGAKQIYKVRVHNDETVPTSSIELQIPEGATVVSVAPMTGAASNMTKTGDRVTAITWKIAVQPGKYVELPFTVQNPTGSAQLQWNVHEMLSDGKAIDWNDKPGAEGKASVTKLNATTLAAPAAK